MATDSLNRQIDLLISTGNSAQDVARLQAEIANLQRFMEASARANRAAGMTLEEIANDARATSSRIAELTALLDAYNQRLNGSGINAQAAARGVLELSRGLEDLATGGWLGILNNIPGIISSIGQAAGLSAGAVNSLTAAASLAGTAAFVLYTHWSKLEELFGLGIERPAIEGIRGLKKELEEAEKTVKGFEGQTRLSLQEFDEYEKATAKVAGLNAELERQKDLQALLSGKSKAERERASGFKEAVAESGDAAQNQLLDALRGKADARGLVIDPTTNREATPQQATTSLLLAAAAGEKQARTQILGLLNEAYGGKSSFARNIVEASPEEKARKKALDAQIEEANRQEEGNIKEASAQAEAAARAAEAERLSNNRQVAALDAANDKQLADAAKAAGRAAKQRETAAQKADREADAAAKVAGAGMRGIFEQELLLNEANRLQGLPHFTEAAVRANQTARAAQGLRQLGQDPRLAGRVVEQARDQAMTDVAKNAGQTSSLMEAVSLTMIQVAGAMQGVQQSNMRTAQNVMGVRTQLGRMRNGRPALQRLGN